MSDLATAWEFTDAIRDFRRAEGDRIHLGSIDAGATANGNQAFDFIGKAAFTDAGQVRYINKNGETLILLNTDNDANHEAMIRVSGTQTPTDGWFIV
jgi:hypothetical protein